MENLISLVNKLQRACTALGDHGEDSALPTLWDSLPSIAVVGGQVPDFFFFLFIFWQVAAVSQIYLPLWSGFKVLTLIRATDLVAVYP
jgi:hypothetical protein